jgi:peptidoglycan/xylan/chitin deacetylase (PgdA/CDA1 family)
MLTSWSKTLAAEVLWHTGALGLTRSLWRDRLLILRYHSICGDSEKPDYVSPSISVPVTAFEQQVRHLSRSYECISLDQAVISLTSGERPPSRAVAVTFDDGYRDNYRYALPILSRYRVPATIYLVSSTLRERRALWTSRLRQALNRTARCELVVPGLCTSTLPLDSEAARASAARTLTNTLNQMSAMRRDDWIEQIARLTGAPAPPPVEEWFLTPDQIREMSRNGITFGAHTISHPNLPGIPPREARTEITQSRAELESLLGMEVAHFSYPNSGAFHDHVNDFTVRCAREAGYRSAVTSHEGSCTSGHDRHRLSRVGINRARSSPARFNLLLETARRRRDSQPEGAYGGVRSAVAE